MAAPLSLLADMNISPQTVAALHREGWDIVRVSALLPANASDVEILGLARRLGRIVITQDLDFSTLLALGGYSDPSIVTLRLSNTDPAVVTRRLRQVLAGLESALQSGSAVTVEDNTVRIRNLPIR